MNINDICVQSFFPHVLKKKINKTGEGRSGDLIHKRRNRRSYRVLIQYETWNNMISNRQNNILDQYEEGYVIIVKPEEYFGTQYPKKTTCLNQDFDLGVNGFIYYTTIDQYREYPPLDDWNEVYELSTTGNIDNNTWIGKYALNIRNAGKQKISDICFSGTREANENKRIINIIKKLTGVEENIPKQTGLGNYSYDYASTKMQSDIKKQMLCLIFLTKSTKKETLAKYIFNNQDLFRHKENTKTYQKNITSNDYVHRFEEEINKYILECEKENLLDYDKLHKTGAWNKLKKCVVCPLCGKEIYIESFFAEVYQAEGRRVPTNTQREVVLMHIDALKSDALNHKTYNLGWGHNYCNLIQGDKSIPETINSMKEIISTYEKYRDL